MRNLSPGFKCIISLSLKPISDKHYTHLKFKHTVLGYTLQLTGLLVSDSELGVYVKGEGVMAWRLPLWLESGSEVQTQYTYTNWWPTALAWKRVWGSNPVHIYQLMDRRLPLWVQNGSEVQTQYTYTNWWPDIYRSGLKTGLRFKPSTHIPTDGPPSTALGSKRVWGSNPVHIYQLMAWRLPLWLENGSEVQTQYTYTTWWPDAYRSEFKTGLRFKPSTYI